MLIEDLQKTIDQVELLPKQRKFLVNILYNKDAKFFRYVGGFGCISGNTKIYDHETGSQKTAKEWASIGKELAVFSYNKDIGAVCIKKGSKVYKKDRGQMYKVILENGNEIETIEAHAFLTSDGSWKQLKGIHVGDEILSVQNYLEIASSSQGHYSQDYHQYDELLRQSVTDVITSSPGGQYAQTHRGNVVIYNDDVTEDISKHISPYQLAFNLSSTYVATLVSHLAGATSCPSDEETSERLSVLLRNTTQSLKKSFILPSCSGLGHKLAHDQTYFDAFFLDFLILSLVNLRLLSDGNQNVQQFQPVLNRLYKMIQYRLSVNPTTQSSSALYNNLGDKIIINLPTTTEYSKVVQIIKEKIEYYYDIEVPDTMCYFANGILNHNSGKSFIGCMTGIILSYMYPKNLGVICRSTLVDLKNTTMKTFFEVCDLFGLSEGTHYTFDRHEQRLKFDNGSEIIFTGLDDIAKIKGMEPGWFYIDEVDEVDPEVFKVLQRRLRNKHTDRRIGFITSNSEGKNRTYQIFIRGEGIPEQYRSQYYSFRASSLENRFLPPDYIDNLLSFDTDYFKRYVLGEFNVFEGQIYDEFTEIVHVVDDFTIPDERQIAYGHDHGLSNPTAFVEGRINNDGELFITWEHYEAGKAISYHADKLKSRRKDLALPLHGQPQVISDPSIFAKTQLPTPERPYPWSVADEYMERGISPTRANNEVLAGINRIKELLKIKKIFIFKSCENTIKEIQGYRWEKFREGMSKKETPVKKNDHLCDAARYLVMAKLGPTRKKLKSGFATIDELVTDDIQRARQPHKYKDHDEDFI